MRPIIVCLIFAFTFYASPATAGELPPLVGSSWVATNDNGKTELALSFEADRQLTGSIACNRCNGSYQQQGDALTIYFSACSRQICVRLKSKNSNPIIDVTDVPNATASAKILEDKLHLFDSAGKEVLVLDRAIVK